jgi:hypothetical protein
MTEHDELLDGENVDPRDEAALREALHDQLCLDAALTARLGGRAAEDRIRHSVLVALQSCGEPESRRRVMHDARLHRSHRVSRHRAAPWALAAAAVVLVMSAGWWFSHVAPTETPVANQSPAPEVPRIIEKAAPLLASQKPTEEPIALIPAPAPSAAPTRPGAPATLPPGPAPAPPPPATIASAPVVMQGEAAVAAGAVPVIAAKPAAETKPTLGTPPPAPVAPVMTDSSTRRDPALWPFNAASPWNMPVGSDARLEAIVPTGFAAQPIGFQPRTIYLATAQQPVVRIKRPRGAAIKLPFAREWADALAMRAAPVTVIEPNGQWAVEYHGLRRSGADWEVAGIARISLLEDGVGREGRGIGALGLPALAGVIRSGEWQNGIPHVIGISVPASMLNAKANSGRAWVWPVQPELALDTTGFATRGNLHLGSLLALPADAHPSKLGMAEGTPHYRLALALWNYGACIVGSSKEGGGGISLLTETLGSGNMDREALSRVFGRLQVVTNRSSTRPGGGGKPRCELAPSFVPPKI